LAKNKGLALLSGGLDSTLAVKVMVDQGVEIEAVHFTTPFCNCDKCSVDQVGEQFNIPVHHIFMGQEFLDLVADPPHGYGSQMNICIDCRINMFRKAKKLGDEIGAEFYVTGEVLGQRPFSQRRNVMKLIETKAGLEGRILRPL
jgi:tRNA U34 2-thiouridine synthase MnmA/TrmU